MTIIDALYKLSEKLGVPEKSNTIAGQINLLCDYVGVEHGRDIADSINNYSGGYWVHDEVTVSAVDDDTVIFDKPASEMQEDIEVTGNKITGTLHELTDGSLVTTYGRGYFIALQFTDIANDITSVLVGLSPSMGTGLVEVINDPDRNGGFKITNKYEQEFVVKSSDGTHVLRQAFDLSELVLVPANEE